MIFEFQKPVAVLSFSSRTIRDIYDFIHLNPLCAGTQFLRVKARDLLSYFANRELGMSTVHLARILKIGQPAVTVLSNVLRK